MNIEVGPIVAARALKQTPPDTAAHAFARDGFLGPVRLLSAEDSKSLAVYIRKAAKPVPADWSKGSAVTDRVFYDLAMHPQLLALLYPLLGETIVLWGASIAKRAPGKAHPWHTDIESAAPEGRFVSCWIGIENTSRESALQLISQSHNLPPIQQVMRERGVSRGAASNDDVLGWTRGSVPGATLIQPDMSDGEALLFDGRLWHGSRNAREAGQRTAILLQYATGDSPVRMPDPQRVTWPFRFYDAPRPPVIAVRGRPKASVNRLVPPPPPLGKPDTPLLSTAIRKLKFPLSEDPVGRWKSYPLFRGVTRAIDWMSCHISVLSAGHMPHPPHAHPEEEMLMVLDGEADVILAARPDPENARRERLSRGALTYYPPFQHHTIHNTGPYPVTYMMFKWRGPPSGMERRLDTSIFRFAAAAPAGLATAPIAQQRVFEGTSAYLRKLHAHTTVMQPGASYKPHADPYDVAILVLSGEVKTLSRTVRANGVVYYAAGEMHGMANRSDETATYLVFEFHPS
jgi:mannose-6-phosphate isomerase-like protein (cupin superfamily)/uncharacterized RmlC-like cupin family protein